MPLILERSAIPQQMLLRQLVVHVMLQADVMDIGIAELPRIPAVCLIIDFHDRDSEVGNGTAIISNGPGRNPVARFIIPVQRSEHVAPKQRSVHDILCRSLFVIAPGGLRMEPEQVTTGIEVRRKLVSFSELVGDLCVQIGKGISSEGSVRMVHIVKDGKERNGQSLRPCPSQSDIERCPALYQGSLILKTSVDETDAEQAVVFLEIAIPGGHIHDRRHLRSVARRKSALIKIHAADDVGIEGGEQSQKMADLINRDSVDKKQIVAAVPAMDIKP